MCRSILSLSKISHQIKSDHPFGQRNRTTERAVRVGVGGDREAGRKGGWAKFEKGGLAILEGHHKIGGWHPSANYQGFIQAILMSSRCQKNSMS